MLGLIIGDKKSVVNQSIEIEKVRILGRAISEKFILYHQILEFRPSLQNVQEKQKGDLGFLVLHYKGASFYVYAAICLRFLQKSDNAALEQ